MCQGHVSQVSAFVRLQGVKHHFHIIGDGHQPNSRVYIPNTLPETNSSPLKTDGWKWKMTFLLEGPLFSEAFAISFRESVVGFVYPILWSNYSDLTRVFTPNGALVREVPLFQGNLAW